MSAFRLGIVGIGDMASIHAGAAKRLGVDLAIAAGGNRARAADLAAASGGALYESYDALLADPTIVGVDLCVPNDLHRQFAERAFAAGKHVLCEKPIALTLDDADAMIAAAAAADRTFMVGHLVRFWPEYARLRDVLESGELGKIQWLSLRRLTGVLSATTGRDDWRASPDRGGGAALDLQIHDLDYACWLFGTPTSVYARGVQSKPGTWDHLLTSLTFDGVEAIVEASFLMQSAPFDMAFHVVAEHGVVTYRYSPAAFALHGLHGEGIDSVQVTSEPSLKLHSTGQEMRGLYTPERDSFELAIESEIGEFVSSISNGRAPICTGNDARRSLAVSLASLRSCQTGRVIHDDIDPPTTTD